MPSNWQLAFPVLGLRSMTSSDSRSRSRSRSQQQPSEGVDNEALRNADRILQELFPRSWGAHWKLSEGVWMISEKGQGPGQLLVLEAET